MTGSLRRLFPAILLLCAAAQARGLANRIAAVVGDAIILESEVVQAKDYARLATYDTITPDSTLRRQVLDRLIDDQVLLEQAGRESIEVDNSEVEAEARANVEQVKQRFESEADFAAALQSEGLTERQFFTRARDEVRRRALAQKLMQKAGLTSTYVSPAQAERFYNERRDSIALQPGRVTLAHIVVAVRPSEEAELAGQRRITEVIQLLASGGEFPALARSFSDDRKNAARGGDWGWVDGESLPPGYEMVLSQLEPGQIGQPFRGPDGYLVLKLESKSGGRYRLRSILVRVATTRADSLKALQRAETVRRQALAGVPFDSLAMRWSDDPSTAEQGGLLGDYPLDGLSAPFDAVVLELDSGEVSEPVRAEHGYHLIKVLAKQETKTLSFLEMQDAIRSYLQQQQLAERLEQYLVRISKTVFIRRYE